jgi:hypothetical protein
MTTDASARLETDLEHPALTPAPSFNFQPSELGSAAQLPVRTWFLRLVVRECAVRVACAVQAAPSRQFPTPRIDRLPGPSLARQQISIQGRSRATRTEVRQPLRLRQPPGAHAADALLH